MILYHEHDESQLSPHLPSKIMMAYLPVHGVREHAQLAAEMLHHTLETQTHPERRNPELKHLMQREL